MPSYLSLASRALTTVVIACAIGATAVSPSRGNTAEIPTAQTISKPRWIDSYRNLPLSFEAGPAGAPFDFVSRAEGYDLALAKGEVTLRLRSSELRMRLAGANPSPRAEGVDALPGKSNYIVGSDPRRWRTNVANFARVRYREVYPGVDLIYYGADRRLEYDFIVAPGADPASIRLKFSGASSLAVDASGDLVLRTAGGEIRMRKPVIYQEANGGRTTVEGRYSIRNPQSAIRKQEVGFELGDYDRERPLVIDPVLSYSALIDGEFIHAIAVDAEGAVYFTGLARSVSFPISPSAHRSTRGNADASAAFVAKLNAAGTALDYSTYIGGFERFDYPYGIAVDAGGHAYVAGFAGSSDFPTTPGAFQPAFAGPGQVGNNFGGDGFVLKLNPTGTGLVYSTFLGGLGQDQANDVAVDADGNAYITGDTSSSNFPVSPDAPQRSISGFSGSGFVTKLNAQGSSLVWSTFVGRSTRDSGEDLTIDAEGNAYVTGEAFPNIFVARVNKDGKSFGYYTRLTGNGLYSEGFGIAVDSAGAAYVTGQAAPGLQTTGGAFQRNHGGAAYDAFVAKINPAGGVAFLSYLGGKGEDRGRAIAVDAAGAAYVTGDTESDNFPVANAFQPNFGKPEGSSTYRTAFVTKVSPDGSATPFSSYYGLGGEEAAGIALDKLGRVVIGGRGAALTAGAFFSTNPTALQSPFGAFGGFITKIDETAAGMADLAVSIKPNDKFFPGTILSYVVTVANVGAAHSFGPVRLRFNLTSNSFIKTVTGPGWYGFTQFISSPFVVVYTGSLAPGQEAKLTVEFFSYVNDEVKAEASITNNSDGNSSNNSASDTTAVVKGCFNGGSVQLSQIFPAAGGTYTHPVNILCTSPWKAVSNVSWITINSGPATGNGSFSYTVAPNTTTAQRTGSIVFEGIALEITQDFTPGIANVSAASFGLSIQSRQETLARASIVALFGKDLSPVTQAATQLPLPTELGGVTVKIKDSFGSEHAAPLFFVSPTQINYLLPAEATTGFATVTVSIRGGSPQTDQTGTIRIAAVTPGLFSANADGGGPPAGVLLRVKANGAQSFEPVAEYDQTQRKFVHRQIDFGPDLGVASDQLYLILFGTGFRNRSSLANAAVSNSEGAAAALYAGPQGDFVGLDQLNIQLRRRMIDFGTVYLVLYADGQPSNRLEIQFKR
jgi:uncharacterized protein (TIGR03437 family)